MIDAPQDRETAGLDVATLVKWNTPHESPETEVMAVISRLDAKPMIWYSFYGFGHGAFVFMGTYPMLLFLPMLSILPPLAICKLYHTAS
jgi:hypothetical protein